MGVKGRSGGWACNAFNFHTGDLSLQQPSNNKCSLLFYHNHDLSLTLNISYLSSTDILDKRKHKKKSLLNVQKLCHMNQDFETLFNMNILYSDRVAHCTLHHIHDIMYNIVF